jgi:hypothetical protein
MDRTYDLFETVNGELIWRCYIEGREAALAILRERAGRTANELCIMHLPTNEVIARANGKERIAS